MIRVSSCVVLFLVSRARVASRGSKGFGEDLPVSGWGQIQPEEGWEKVELMEKSLEYRLRRVLAEINMFRYSGKKIQLHTHGITFLFNCIHSARVHPPGVY